MVYIPEPIGVLSDGILHQLFTAKVCYDFIRTFWMSHFQFFGHHRGQNLCKSPYQVQTIESSNYEFFKWSENIEILS